MSDLYCSMIHGGLNLDLKLQSQIRVQHCCLRNDLWSVKDAKNIWHNQNYIPLRAINLENKWANGCANCENLEKSGMYSFRDGMNDGLGIFKQQDLSGPARIDLMFDISCNLACRTCGTWSSTFWQKHLKQHGEWNQPIFTPRNKQDVIECLKNLDLSNLRQVVFCGGETLMGQEYWHVAEWLGDNVPNAKENLMICFQTNGTQPISEKQFGIIEKLSLVKLHISIDGLQQRFEYLRWPAQWNQVVDNILNIRQRCPTNVMFVIEETISIFNLAYLEETDQWVKENFSTNRDGDVVNHTRHLAQGRFSLANCSQEYVDHVSMTSARNLINCDWQENVESISVMINEIKKFDLYRDQSFSKTFPEVHDHYRRFW